MSFTRNAKDVKDDLITILTNTGNYQEVLGYPKLDLESKSPICLVYRDGIDRKITTADYKETEFYFAIIHAVKRTNDRTHADLLDDLELGLVQALEANYANQWTLVEYNDRTMVFYDMSDGQEAYVYETFPIRILQI